MNAHKKQHRQTLQDSYISQASCLRQCTSSTYVLLNTEQNFKP